MGQWVKEWTFDLHQAGKVESWPDCDTEGLRGPTNKADRDRGHVS